MWKLLHYDHRLQVNDPTMQQHAAEFIAWRLCLTTATLSSEVWVKSFLDVATLAANRADDFAASAATRRFVEWVNDGPAGD